MHQLAPNLAHRLQNGETIYGCFVELPCAESVEIAALAGWDFCVVDSEHSSIAPPHYANMVRAGESRRMQVVVRVPENRPALIQQALDAGAGGVVIPQVSSYEAALAAVSASRFFPIGQRGVNGVVRAAAYSALPAADYLAEANRETLCVVQLESAQACVEAARIAAIPGIDVLFIGPWDLSQSLQVPGQTSHPLVLSEIERVRTACLKQGIAAGIYANTPDDARAWASQGFRFVTCLVDSAVLLRGLQELRASLHPTG